MLRGSMGVNRRSRSRIKVYYIIRNGLAIGTGLGDNSRAALITYCRLNEIAYNNGVSIGNCGYPTSTCSKNYLNGYRPCGLRGKCSGIYKIDTALGILMAIQA